MALKEEESGAKRKLFSLSYRERYEIEKKRLTKREKTVKDKVIEVLIVIGFIVFFILSLIPQMVPR